MSDSCLEVKKLDKNYGQKKILTDINLSLQEGEIMGLVGPNGADFLVLCLSAWPG